MPSPIRHTSTRRASRSRLRKRCAAARTSFSIATSRIPPMRACNKRARCARFALREARSRVAVPLVAIGGITPDNGAVLIAAGADALAAISGVFDQPDVAGAARRYASLFVQQEKP